MTNLSSYLKVVVNAQPNVQSATVIFLLGQRVEITGRLLFINNIFRSFDPWLSFTQVSILGRLWNPSTNLGHRPVREMEKLGLVKNGIGIPFFQRVSKVASMFFAAELSCQKIVATVWQDESAVFV